MNKKVIYYDGKVVVLNENGEERPIIYTDNYDKILVQENIIEECENIIKCLECESDKYKKFKLMERLSALYPFLMFTFVPPIMLTLMNKGAGISNNEVVETLLGPMTTNELIGILSQYFIPIGGLGSLIKYNSCIKDDRSENGTQVCLEFLRDYLTVQKEKLEDLKTDTTVNDREDGFKVFNINDTKDLNTLYRYRVLFFDLGYDLERNYMYYMTHGELPKKLEKIYGEEEKIKAKEYLEEKAKILRKGKK